MGTPFNWTDQRVEMLLRLWADGVSQRDIGKIIGIGRDAIANKAKMLDLPRRVPETKGRRPFLQWHDRMPRATAPWPAHIPDVPGYFEDDPRAR